jgi:AcrR family transcriptional regulator
MNDSVNLADRILDTALGLADERSWERLRLHDIAAELDIPLAYLQRCYRSKDDLVEAWYDRADKAMLAAAQGEDFLSLDKAERLHRLIMTWLDALATHKTVSGDMLLYKLEPAHLHLQVLGLLRISRTVQWFLEAAQSDTSHLQRIAEEIGLTAIYLLTFNYWMRDRSARQQATREFLRRRLDQATFCSAALCCGCREKPSNIKQAEVHETSPPA